MSWNLHDLQDDRAAAARAIRAVDPDVLCLQEVPRRLTTQLRVPPFADPAGRHTTSWPPEPPTG
ncbi:MAG TPA: endonuclease/exonuclease/phosphatase family protein [Terrabacter sp.]|nr:endonuclease/exonuclease/phosphatase family protein [Terrabacter sp.]